MDHMEFYLIAPKLLMNKPYTMAFDIYSFGIITEKCHLLIMRMTKIGYGNKFVNENHNPKFLQILIKSIKFITNLYN